jgi:lactam utilization protein B
MSTNSSGKPGFSQDDVNYGQRRINGALSNVDNWILYSIGKLKVALEQTPGLQKIDFTELNRALEQAATQSKKVAEIKPPGCIPPDPPDQPPPG